MPCTCQAYPTHCANDCPEHGLEPPFDGVPPTEPDEAFDDTELLQALFERMARPRRLTGKRGVTTNAAYCDLYDRVAARLGKPGSIT